MKIAKKEQLKSHILQAEESIDILKNIKKEIKLPLTESEYVDLKESNIYILDSVAFRFAKIQAIIGEKLFKEILNFMQIDINNKTFPEILVLLEREGILDSINDWKELREIRNSLAHDYPDEIDEVIDTINYIFEKLYLLEEIVAKIRQNYEKVIEIESRRD